MQTKRIHYALAALSFFAAFFTYAMTMQPSIPFWDCGEFISAASQLGISHPPGTPFWTLFAHVAVWLMPVADLAARYNMLSVLCGSLSSMLLYLTAVRVIALWRGSPKSITDVVIHYGGALVAAMSFTWSDSVWFNSNEFIIFSPGLLLICLCMWLGMIWHEKSDEPGAAKYLMLIAYLIGLSMGVHQMTMLVFFPVWMLVYYKHYPKTTLIGWVKMALAGSLAFLFIFFVVLTGLVGWLGGNKVGTTPVIILVACAGFLYYLWTNKRPLAQLLLTAAGLLILGYSTYAFVMVRAVGDPPMNQHSPSNFTELHDYIARLQFGEAREWPRRDDRQKEGEPLHAPTWDEKKYSSEMDFMTKYQIDHMYVRYLLWNFVGRAHDNQDAPVDWSHTAGIPLLLGFFGMFWHFRRDPKRAMAMLAGFLIMGLFTALYQNQQDAQPRERDYFYVGAFWIYAMWVGIGASTILQTTAKNWMRGLQVLGALIALGLVSMFLEPSTPLIIMVLLVAGGLSGAVWLTNQGEKDVEDSNSEDGAARASVAPSMGMVGLAFAAIVALVPLNQCLGIVGLASGQDFKHASKWGEYSRHHDDFPLEYSYNILQSCEPDAVLFTAGDNDTFPLWCIQDLYGVRRDVRIVNLSLGNMGWYIKKLKQDLAWGGKKLKLPSFTDQMLSAPEDSPEGVHPIPAAPSMVRVDVSAATMAKFTGNAQPGSFSWKWVTDHTYQNGQFIYYVADQLIKDIVVNNFDDRPIYFGVGVTPGFWNGLEGHVVYEGFTVRVVPTEHKPVRGNEIDGDINEPLYLKSAYDLAKGIETKPSRGSLANTFRDPSSNRSGLEERYGTSTYLEVYGRLANYYLNHNNIPEAHRALDTLGARMPPATVDWDYRSLQEIGQLYQAIGDKKLAMKYFQFASKALASSSQDEGENADENTMLRNKFQRAILYFNAEQFDSARAGFNDLRRQVPNGGPDQQFFDFKLAQIDARVLETRGDKQGALKKLNEILVKFASLAQQGGLGSEIQAAATDRDRLMKELGMADTNHGAPVIQLPQGSDEAAVPVKPAK